MAWSFYRSIIAFNSPTNIRETRVDIRIDRFPAGDIEYRRVLRTPVNTKGSSWQASTNLTSASALQLVDGRVDDPANQLSTPPNPAGFRLTWHLVPNGGGIRRETAYDVIAYAILWTSQYSESTKFTGLREMSVPGGRVVVRFMSNQNQHHDPMTFGFAATVIKSLPQVLENFGHFVESFALVSTPDNEVCGYVGIWNRGTPPSNVLDGGVGNNTALSSVA